MLKASQPPSFPGARAKRLLLMKFNVGEGRVTRPAGDQGRGGGNGHSVNPKTNSFVAWRAPKKRTQYQKSTPHPASHRHQARLQWLHLVWTMQRQRNRKLPSKMWYRRQHPQRAMTSGHLPAHLYRRCSCQLQCTAIIPQPRLRAPPPSLPILLAHHTARMHAAILPPLVLLTQIHQPTPSYGSLLSQAILNFWPPRCLWLGSLV